MTKRFLTAVSVFLALILVQQVSAQALQEGFVGPGGCTTKEECRTYCDVDDHKDECLNFALENGLMSREEVDRAKKFLDQTGPGGCRGEACRTYCDDPANTDQCILFAEENGLIRPEEAARMRKFKEIETEGGPGGCRGQECQTYCENESHMDECFVFAREKGLIGEEEIKRYETGLKIKETIQTSGGPGGCTSERECHEYCSNTDNLEECVAFGAASTGMSPEEIRMMLEQFKEGVPPHGDQFEEDRFRQRFEDYGDEFQNREFDRMSPVSNFRGPGGCDSETSCREYCMNNPEECGSMPRSSGPDGTYEGDFDKESMEARMRERMESEGYKLPEEYQVPPGYPPESYSNPEVYQQYEGYPQEPIQQYYQYPQNTEPTEYRSEPVSEPAPTSYDHSRSFLSNMATAFMAPFRK